MLNERFDDKVKDHHWIQSEYFLVIDAMIGLYFSSHVSLYAVLAYL